MYEKRRATLKEIPKFWAFAILNHEILSVQVVHWDDQNAMSYLEDLWIARDPRESRAFTLEFVSRDAQREWESSDTEVFRVLTVLQGEPILQKHRTEEGVQVHSSTSGCRREARCGRDHPVDA